MNPHSREVGVSGLFLLDVCRRVRATRGAAHGWTSVLRRCAPASDGLAGCSTRAANSAIPVGHNGFVSTVAVIGDVGGHVGQLRDALASLGVTASSWPVDLEVVQLGDLFGGNDDMAVVELVGPHLYAGRWTQLVGNWELRAVGGPAVVNSKGREADSDALQAFASWNESGLIHSATTVTSSTGSTGVVTHAGIGYNFWSSDLGGQRDPVRVAARLNTMPITQVARPGSMFGQPNERAPGPIWTSTEELWSGWKVCPFPQIHGHSCAHSSRGWNEWVPEKLRQWATANRGHVTFKPSSKSSPIIGIDPGLWDRSPRHSLRPLVFHPA